MRKLYFIAALAAFPLFAHAAPGAESDPVNATAKAMPLAIDYMTREYEARLQPRAKGQPARPDLPSNIAFTPEHLAALRTVFGTEQPLQVQRLPGKGPSTQYSMVMPARSYAEDGSRYSWQTATSKLSIDKKGQVATTAVLPFLETSSNDGTFTLEGMRASGTRQRDTLTGTSHVEADRLVIKKTGGPDMVLRNVTVRSDVTRKGKLLNMQADTNVQQIAVGGASIDNMHVAMRLRNLDQDTVTAMRKIVESIGNGAGTDQAKTLALIGELKPLMVKLLQQGAAVDIDDISAVYRGNKAALKISVGMPGATAADFDTAERVMQKLAVKIHVQIPLPMLRDIATMAAERSNQGKDNPPVPTAQLAGQIYDAMLGKAVGGNFAKVEKNALVSTVELKGGNLFVNAQAFPIEPLLALLKGPKTPPPGKDQPPAIGMEPRRPEDPAAPAPAPASAQPAAQ